MYLSPVEGQIVLALRHGPLDHYTVSAEIDAAPFMMQPRTSNCSAGEQDPYGRRHRWSRDPGQPLACDDCGEHWPGGPFPEYICRVEGNHQEEIRASGMWSVRDMINAMKAMD